MQNKPLDIQRLRADTPGCLARVHLNNAGSALMPEPVAGAIHEHISLESRIGGYEAAEARADAVQAAYQSVADLIGAQPRNIAFTENATASFIQALSSTRLQRGDVIYVPKSGLGKFGYVFSKFGPASSLMTVGALAAGR